MPAKLPKWLVDVTGTLSGSRRAKVQESQEKLKLRLDREERQMDRRPQSMYPSQEKKAKYNSKLMSPKGDFGKYQEGELHRAFPRRIKNYGRPEYSSSYLPAKKAGPMEKDGRM